MSYVIRFPIFKSSFFCISMISQFPSERAQWCLTPLRPSVGNLWTILHGDDEAGALGIGRIKADLAAKRVYQPAADGKA